jgi:toxin ParE1/3/4
MSARRAQVVLNPAARRDVRSILLYTARHWGSTQRDDYRALMDRAVASISENPQIGRARDDISPGIHSYRVGQHIIFYRIAGDTVRVVRILHERMDPGAHVRE